jgi:hypothetical protein
MMGSKTLHSAFSGSAASLGFETEFSNLGFPPSLGELWATGCACTEREAMIVRSWLLELYRFVGQRCLQAGKGGPISPVCLLSLGFCL